MTHAGEGDGGGPGIHVTKRRWAWLVGFCGLTEGDLALLADVPAPADLSAAAAHAFYAHVLTYPELRELIERTSTVERLRGHLQRYFQSLFDGSYDDVRVDQMTQVGTTHDRIGLPFACYMGATLKLDEVVIPALIDCYGDDRAKLARALMAYRKLSTCDSAIVLQNFCAKRDVTTKAALAGIGVDS